MVRHMFNRIIGLVALSVLLMAIMSFTTPVIASPNSVNIFPQGSKPYGLPYDEHIKNFWRWLILIPEDDTPRNDPTGERCTTGQSNTNSTVFYLSPTSGGKAERTCRVPEGKALFIPVMQVETSDAELPNASVEDLASSAKSDQDNVNSLYLKIGDKEYNYENLTKFRTRTGPFEVVFPDNGIFGVLKGGTFNSVADGFYIITEPLTKGNYLIHFKSSLMCPDGSCAFAQDVQYNIIVE
jgi:hypothetical protein